MKRPYLLAAGGIAVMAAITALLWYVPPVEEETSRAYVCRVCGSYRVENERSVAGATISSSQVSQPSAAFTDVLGGDHEHDWAFECSNSSKRVGLLAYEQVHGDGFPGFSGRVPNEFTRSYNDDAWFRDFVKERIDAGELSRGLARNIVLLENLQRRSPAADRATVLLRAHFPWR